MKQKRVVGVVLIVVASVVGFWGYQQSQTIASQLGGVLGNSMPKEVLLAYVASVLSMLTGLWLTIKS
jgi:hypothetical protein